jgi:hypothetical protein
VPFVVGVKPLLLGSMPFENEQEAMARAVNLAGLSWRFGSGREFGLIG